MKNFNKKIQDQFDMMCSTGKLFRVDVPGQKLWDLYLESFETKPIFRDPASNVHNCNLCNNFIRRYGNVVAIVDNQIVSIFDIEADEEMGAPAKALSNLIKRSKVSNVFFETFKELNALPYEKCSKNSAFFQLGVDTNVKQYTKEEAEKFGVVKPDEIRRFSHMHLSLPRAFVDMSDSSIETIAAGYRDAHDVFLRGMETISLDTLELVRDLIAQGSLLDGQTHLYKIESIIPLKKEYDNLQAAQRDNWCWVNSYKLPFAKFRNELIGVLCSELSEGEEINKAVMAWNKRVDPVNYMKTTAPISKKQIAEAKAFVEENGYTESFDRRLATLGDIKVSEIKHINSGDGSIKSVSIFDNVKATSSRHKRNEFDGIEEVSIEKFMKDILPGCTSVEALLLNSHQGHMVTLTTAKNIDSKPIFKWSNNYSWTFNGNIAGRSLIKEAVGARGGKIDGVLRFSIMWAEGDPCDNSDLDAWAQEPEGGNMIGYSTPYRKDRGGNPRTTLSGQLDVDITHPNQYGNKNIVENIVWDNKSKMRDGVYKLWVNQYEDRGSEGFRAEIEFDGETYTYDYPRKVSGNVTVAEVTLSKGVFTIKHLLPEGGATKEIYGLETNKFHKVNLICLSPNHWDANNVGNKHYFFMLEGCKAQEPVRGFHNENLIPELASHRKVMEVLGNSNMIDSAGNQLSGLGFNATVKDELVVKLAGSFKRVIKIRF